MSSHFNTPLSSLLALPKNQLPAALMTRFRLNPRHCTKAISRRFALAFSPFMLAAAGEMSIREIRCRTGCCATAASSKHGVVRKQRELNRLLSP